MNTARATNVYPFQPARGKTETSAEAADHISPQAATIRENVRLLLEREPLTADQCAERLGLDRLTVRPRLTELYQTGQVLKCREKRPNASGVSAQVYTANPQAVETQRRIREAHDRVLAAAARGEQIPAFSPPLTIKPGDTVPAKPTTLERQQQAYGQIKIVFEDLKARRAAPRLSEIIRIIETDYYPFTEKNTTLKRIWTDAINQFTRFQKAQYEARQANKEGASAKSPPRT